MARPNRNAYENPNISPPRSLRSKIKFKDESAHWLAHLLTPAFHTGVEDKIRKQFIIQVNTLTRRLLPVSGTPNRIAGSFEKCAKNGSQATRGLLLVMRGVIVSSLDF